MLDFSLVSPRTWEEKILDSIVNATNIGTDSKAKTLYEYLLERQAGITDVDTKFASVNPRTLRETLLKHIVDGTFPTTVNAKTYEEKALAIALNFGSSSELRNPQSYREYLSYAGLDAIVDSFLFMLQENADLILLESGDYMLLEDGS